MAKTIEALRIEKAGDDSTEVQADLDNFLESGSSVKTVNAYSDLISEKKIEEIQAIEDAIKSALGLGFTVERYKKKDIETDEEKPSIIKPTWRIYKNG